MHPEIMRQLTVQRSRDLQERAYRAQVVRKLRTLRRRRRPEQADEVVIPAIPDYVDGSFRTAEDAADQGASQVPAARNAA